MTSINDCYCFDISGYIEIIQMFQCKLCGSVDSTNEKMVLHLLSNHLQNLSLCLSVPVDNTSSVATGYQSLNLGGVNSEISSKGTIEENNANFDETSSNVINSKSDNRATLPIPGTQAGGISELNSCYKYINYSTTSNDLHNEVSSFPLMDTPDCASRLNFAQPSCDSSIPSNNILNATKFDNQIAAMSENVPVSISSLEPSKTFNETAPSQELDSLYSKSLNHLMPKIFIGSLNKSTQDLSDTDLIIPLPEELQERCSIGVQVQLIKKPGRKPKNPVADDIEDENGINNLVNNVKNSQNNTGDSVINQEPGYTTVHNVVRSSGKRTIKPPSYFSDSYHPSAAVGYKNNEVKNIKEIEDPSFVCIIAKCGERFPTEIMLEYHTSCHGIQKSNDTKKDSTSQNAPGKFRCPDCKVEFRTWKLARRHAWREHSFDAGMLKCNSCNFCTDVKQVLLAHQETHSENRLYRCAQCNRSFKQRSQLLNHITTHSAEEQGNKNKIICSQCSKTFANKRTLQKHVECVHEKISNYLCTHCGYKTTRKALLQLHIRTHTGEKPYKCKLCGFTMSDHNTLRRHIMRHSGQKPYKCSFCSYTCIQSISLKLHQKRKHAESSDALYKCGACGYHTVNSNNWISHQKEKHGLKI